MRRTGFAVALPACSRLFFRVEDSSWGLTYSVLFRVALSCSQLEKKVGGGGRNFRPRRLEMAT